MGRIDSYLKIDTEDLSWVEEKTKQRLRRCVSTKSLTKNGYNLRN